MNRRHFLVTLLAPALLRAEEKKPTRELDFQIDAKPFGAGEADILAVLRSATGEIWRHCATTTFELGFRIYRHDKFPITHYLHDNDRIVIGLNTGGQYWSQYAFQFAHEFCHALMDHANNWRRLWHNGDHANQWLEEAFCETASLFALRAMGKTWQTKPPFGNWRDYAKNLTSYAQDRLDDPKHQLPAGKTFAVWLAEVLPIQRKKWTRENNTIAARQLLPLFEAEPAGWDALPALNLCTREPQKNLARFLEEWKLNAAPAHHVFIEKVRAVLQTAAP